MTDLPDGWRWVRLSDVAGKPQYGWTTSARADAEGLPLLRTTDITRGPIQWATVPRCVDSPKDTDRYLLATDDIVVSRAGSVGVSALIADPPIAVFASYLMRLRPGTDVHPRFLRAFLLSPQYWSQISDVTNGIALPNINSTKLAAVKMPLPPLKEQQRIVELLEDHLSRLDAAERYLSGVLLKTDVAQGAVLQALLRSGDASQSGDVSSLAAERHRRCPPGMKRGRPTAVAPAEVEVPWEGRWPTVSLEESTDPVRTVSYGILKPGPDIEAGIPYVRVLNMRNDVLALHDLHRTSPEIAAQYARAGLEPNDVLVSIRGTFGRVVLVPPELRGGNITQDTARLAVLPPLLPDFVALVLRSPWAQAHLRRAARGVAVKGVNIADLRRVPLPLPSLDVQARLVDRADQMTSDLQAATRSSKAGQRRAGALRHALLSAAFSGRLMPQADELEGSGV